MTRGRQPTGTYTLAVLEALHRSTDELATELRLSHLADGPLRDLAEILGHAEPWAGSMERAYQWFLTQTLLSFGGRTAADLFRAGRADAVKAYLNRIGVGGFT